MVMDKIKNLLVSEILLFYSNKTTHFNKVQSFISIKTAYTVLFTSWFKTLTFYGFIPFTTTVLPPEDGLPDSSYFGDLNHRPTIGFCIIVS